MTRTRATLTAGPRRATLRRLRRRSTAVRADWRIGSTRLARISLVLLGYRADNVLQFQAGRRLQVDGDVGPKTRAAMHTAL
ncbi:lysozyme family protein [Sinorhizobium medicae]